MAQRKTPRAPKPPKRTPLMEWGAAGLGLIVTLAVLGYTVWEGAREGEGPPVITVSAGSVRVDRAGFALPVTVRNESSVTAAQVSVRGVLRTGPRLVEERTAAFTYVPGGGEAKGGLFFQNDPRGYELELVAEGYEEP